MSEYYKDNLLISTDPARLDLDAICDFLSRAYWAEGRTRATVAKTLEHSLCFGLYDGEQQIGFARVITDYATLAWLCDVFIHEDYRGRGLGKWLMSVIIDHPKVQRVRRFLLATRDAHGLYRPFGFTELKSPERWMERLGE